MKEQIIKILEESRTKIDTPTWGGEVIEDHKFELIAEKILKLSCQPAVIKSVCEHKVTVDIDDGMLCINCHERVGNFKKK